MTALTRRIIGLTIMLAFPATMLAQAVREPEHAVTIAAAPIFLDADAGREPLRIAKEGSILVVLDRTPEWCHVEFQDPQYGRRVGYIEARFLRSRAPEPTDVSIADTRQVGSPLQPRVPLTEKSRAAGVFFGSTLENGSINTAIGSAEGVSLLLGYGFGPDYAIYGTISSVGWHGTQLTHSDVGFRFHFLAPTRRFVPFLNIGAGRRVLSYDNVTESGFGATYGGGLTGHIHPIIGITGGLAFTVGGITKTEVRGIIVDGPKARATSARISVGIVVFPQRRNGT